MCWDYIGFGVLGFEVWDLGWVLPSLSNSWIVIIIWLYIALNRTPNIDSYWVGAVPKIQGLGFRTLVRRRGWAVQSFSFGRQGSKFRAEGVPLRSQRI